jgi:hypothetical protein
MAAPPDKKCHQIGLHLILGVVRLHAVGRIPA